MAKARTLIMTKNGEQVTFDKEPASVFATLRNGRYVVSIAKEREPRSIEQNALMWLWFTCIEQETGTPRQDVHDYYCRKFLRKNILFNGRTEVVAEGTSKQSKERMTVFLNQVQADAAMEFGITLPNPDDLYWQEFYNMYK
jgi:hypothetical protein